MVNDCSKQTSPLSRIFLMCECVTFYVLRDSDLGSLYSCYVSCIFFISFYKNAPTSQVVVDFSEFELAVSVNNSRAQVKVSQHTDMLGLKILLVHLWSGEVFSCCTEPRKFVCTWLRECYRQVEADVVGTEFANTCTSINSGPSTVCRDEQPCI